MDFADYVLIFYFFCCIECCIVAYTFLKFLCNEKSKMVLVSSFVFLRCFPCVSHCILCFAIRCNECTIFLKMVFRVFFVF